MNYKIKVMNKIQIQKFEKICRLVFNNRNLCKITKDIIK